MRIQSNLKLAAQKVAFYVTRSRSAGYKVLETTVRNIQERLNVPGDPITYPVNWDSEKQRRAFFATNGFGAGIPYERTGQTVWTMEKPFENEIDLFAPHPAGAVFGFPPANFWQSRIHRGRWPELRSILTQELAKLPTLIRDALKVEFSQGE